LEKGGLSDYPIDETEGELMDEYIVEIDALHDDTVVVVAPALCFLVFGRTVDEALHQARASIGYRLRETAPVSRHHIGPRVSAYLSVRPDRGLNVVPSRSLLLRCAETPTILPPKQASPYRRDQVGQNHAAALMTLELALEDPHRPIVYDQRLEALGSVAILSGLAGPPAGVWPWRQARCQLN
jgi:hypothetical protein